MQTLLDNLKKYTILRAIIFLVLGLLIIIFPQPIMSIIVYIIAAALMIMGIVNIISYFNNRPRAAFKDVSFLSGVLLLVVGIVIAVFSHQILSAIPVVLGIFVILSGAMYFLEALNVQKTLNRSGMPMFIFSILILIVGIILIVNPFSALTFLFRMFGIILLVMGIGDIIIYFLYERNL